MVIALKKYVCAYTQAFRLQTVPRNEKAIGNANTVLCGPVCVFAHCSAASLCVWCGCVMKTRLSYNIISVSVNEHPWTGFSDAQNNMMRCRPAAWWNFSSPLSLPIAPGGNTERENGVLQSEFTIKNTLAKCRRSSVCGGVKIKRINDCKVYYFNIYFWAFNFKCLLFLLLLENGFHDHGKRFF